MGSRQRRARREWWRSRGIKRESGGARRIRRKRAQRIKERDEYLRDLIRTTTEDWDRRHSAETGAGSGAEGDS